MDVLMPEDGINVVGRKPRVSREDWIVAATEVLRESGVDGVKVIVIAKKMGVTSGSFYWHFEKLSDLLDAVLYHWEHHLTDHVIQDAVNFGGSGEQRIYNLMRQVLTDKAAEPDHAISIWAKTDPKARKSYDRTLSRRFKFAAWMFKQIDFSPEDAKTRGRLMVAYLMGESTSNLLLHEDWEETLKRQFEVLVSGRP